MPHADPEDKDLIPHAKNRLFKHGDKVKIVCEDDKKNEEVSIDVSAAVKYLIEFNSKGGGGGGPPQPEFTIG